VLGEVAFRENGLEVATMGWRLAKSLVVLRDETRKVAPGTTVWDIGDQDHADEPSDHNPNTCCDVVCATDTLPDAGLDLGWFAEKVRQAGIDGHPALKYVIYNRRIASRNGGWDWDDYHGSNPHTGHVHTSVGQGPDGQSTGNYDDQSPWGLLEDDMALSSDDITKIEKAVNKIVWEKKIYSPSMGVPEPGREVEDWWIKQGRQAVIDIGFLQGTVDGLVAAIEGLATGAGVVTPEQFQQLVATVGQRAFDGAKHALENISVQG
jgi:hypothetical protein